MTFTKFLRTFGRLLLCIDVYCGQLLVFPNNVSRICSRKLKMRMIYHMNNPFRSSHPEVFRRKGVLKIYSKFTRENTCRSVISIKSQSNFIEIILRHGFSPVNLLHIFRAPFLKNLWLTVFLLFNVLLFLDLYLGLPSNERSRQK